MACLDSNCIKTPQRIAAICSVAVRCGGFEKSLKQSLPTD